MAVHPSVSLCIIARDEEKNLAAAINPLRSHVQEIVVIDTGSTDSTRELAFSLGARVFGFAWCDDFAAARNEAIRRATSDYIFWMDADDRIDEANIIKLTNLVSRLGAIPAGFMMTCVCEPANESGEFDLVPHCRLFPRRDDVRWEYRIHEQIAPSITRAGLVLHRTDIEIHHHGDLDEALVAQKARRNQRLLRMQFATHPNDPWLLYNFGLSLLRDGQPADALSCFLRALKAVETQARAFYVRDVYYHAGSALLILHRLEEALAILRTGMEIFPHDATLAAKAALILSNMGEPLSAEKILTTALKHRESDYSRDDILAASGLRECRRQLGWLYKDSNRFSESEQVFQELLSEKPDCGNAWIGLAYAYIAARKFGDLEFVIRQIEKLPRGLASACVLRSERAMLEGDVAGARSLLKTAMKDSPNLPWPRIVYLNHLMNHGADLAECKEALNEVIRVDPLQHEYINSCTARLAEREKQKHSGSGGLNFASGPLTFT